MFPIIETERLLLREISLGDTEAIFSCFSNELAMQYYGQDPFVHKEQADALIEFFANSYNEKKGIRWGIELKGTPGLIGTIGFNGLVLKHKRAEIGYELHPSHWRKGYVSEAIASVIQYGFSKLHLQRIGAVVFVDNIASNQLLLQTGFEKEGLLRKYIQQNGKPYDTYIYSMVNISG